jgi:hypothetical protein
MVILLTSSAVAMWPPNLELKILCDKSTYLLDEPIWIDILLINHGEDSVDVQLLTPESGLEIFRFIVVDERMDTIPYSGMIIEFVQAGGPTFRLAPGDTAYYVFNLIKAYKWSPRSTRHNEILVQGRIEVTAQFWTGYRSNTLYIEIVEPQGTEAEAHQLLMSTVGRRPDSTKVGPLQEIVNRFPNSVYIETAMYEMNSEYCADVIGLENVHRYGLMLFKKFPGSGYSLYSVPYYLHEGKNPDRAAKLDSLMTADKPFRLRMIARNYQRKLPVY